MIVGLTGGIGSGKSTVAKMFSNREIAVYIADDEAKKLMNTSVEIRKELITAFGDQVYLKNGLNRKYLAATVFGNKEKLEILNKIVHPRVKNHFNIWYAKQKSPYVIKEAAILFENGGYTICDKILLVTAPKEIRIKRVMDRDQMKREEIIARMNHQWSEERKGVLSDFIIQNIDLNKTEQEVDYIHKHLIKKNG